MRTAAIGTNAPMTTAGIPDDDNQIAVPPSSATVHMSVIAARSLIACFISACPLSFVRPGPLTPRPVEPSNPACLGRAHRGRATALSVKCAVLFPSAGNTGAVVPQGYYRLADSFSELRTC